MRVYQCQIEKKPVNAFVRSVEPTATPSRMLKKSASFVLASLRGSTYGTGPPGGRNYSRGFSVRQDSFKGRTAHTKCGTYLLASSLAAALLDGLFEHPAGVFSPCHRHETCSPSKSTVQNGFSHTASRSIPLAERARYGSPRHGVPPSCRPDRRSWSLGCYGRFDRRGG